MQVGIDSFAAATPTDRGGAGDSQSISDLIERIEVADRVGLDVFGIGEHHRREFLDSAPAVILGAAAVRTEKIRLAEPGMYVATTLQPPTLIVLEKR